MTSNGTDAPGDRSSVAVEGTLGAAATGHPRATEAALACLRKGGNAVDAAVTAHAMLAVVLPASCGLGGDALALVHTPDGAVTAFNGTGPSPSRYDPAGFRIDGGASVTVPGAVRCWSDMVETHGRRSLAAVLEPAAVLADAGFGADEPLVEVAAAHRARLLRGGAEGWEVLEARPGDLVRQPELARTLVAVGQDGPDAFYRGDVAEAIARAVVRDGGWLGPDDLRDQRTVVTTPVTVAWGGAVAALQPPTSQGILLAMALQWLERHEAGLGLDTWEAEDLDHLGIELTEAVFAHRHRCARDAQALLDEPLDVDVEVAARRGGPRAYLHTTGVAVADADGMVVSSLLSLFDSFGSGTFAAEAGVVLNNRAAGFTVAPNDPAAGRRPVHTLAPALLHQGDQVTALATPGADGQVQTLLQVLLRRRWLGVDLPDAVDALRWRSVEGGVLVESGHRSGAALAGRGHLVETLPAGDDLFGGVVSASYDGAGRVSAVGDWRRQVSAGAVSG
ncbi:MAG: gamma-glutamyltransferase [Kineosporiaceae bacterium]